MQKAACVALPLLLALWPAPSTKAAPPSDPLWLKAVACAAAAEKARVVPGTVRIDTVVTKKNGTVDHRGTVVFRTVDDGEAEDGVGLEVLSAELDGVDITEKTRKEEAAARSKDKKRKREGGSEDPDRIEITLDYHPFSPKAQSQVTAQREGEDSVEGRPAVRFSFRHTSPSGKQAVVGKTWLDAETGVPLRVEASPDPLPRLADSMLTRVFFTVDAEGRWLPERSTLEGEGGLLMIRRAVRSTVAFSDFRAFAAAAPEPDRP